MKEWKQGLLLNQFFCNILISYMVLDCENAISRASFIQVPSYRSARRQMNHVFCSVRLKSILKFRP